MRSISLINVNLFLLLSLTMTHSSLAFVIDRNTYHVHIVNNLSRDLLTLSCKSKDDNLGLHELGIGQSFSFKFHVNLFKTTLFWCNFDWGEKDHWNSIKVFYYDELFLQYCDYQNCNWSARDDGIYLQNLRREHQPFELMYSWK
ncbi:hypothetical protein SLE2022_248010 [Rubroshorea leprosula]